MKLIKKSDIILTSYIEEKVEREELNESLKGMNSYMIDEMNKNLESVSENLSNMIYEFFHKNIDYTNLKIKYFRDYQRDINDCIYDEINSIKRSADNKLDILIFWSFINSIFYSCNPRLSRY